MQYRTFLQVTPYWEKYAAAIEADEKLRKQLGWVREMYGFSIAMAVNKIPLKLMETPASPFISQLPIDHNLGNASAYHYTQVRRWG